MTEDGGRRIERVEGTAVPMRGNDIDTDRIIPARFLRSVRFEGLEAHVFEDDRRQLEGGPTVHPFSNPAYRRASILLVNVNFACGSSREHAPQALMRWGIQACVGESFSEIFLGNSTALGVPCATAPPDAIEWLMQAVEQAPDTRLSLSLADLTLEAGDRRVSVEMPDTVRGSLRAGTWDATGLLLGRYDEVRALADRLPYVRGF